LNLASESGGSDWEDI